jgi:hypothetical protein
MDKKSVPTKMLLDGAQMTLSALLAGTMGFLKEHGIPIKEWVSYIGNAFDGSLGDLGGEAVDRVMEHLLTLQVLPLGAEISSSQASADKAEVTVMPLPSQAVLKKFGTTPKELLEGFGVTRREFASIYGMCQPAAKAIGLRFTHQLKGGQEILSLERAPGKSNKRVRHQVDKT